MKESGNEEDSPLLDAGVRGLVKFPETFLNRISETCQPVTQQGRAPWLVTTLAVRRVPILVIPEDAMQKVATHHRYS